METFKAFLDYFTLTQWIVIGIVCRVLFWVAEKLTDRYLDRWVRQQRKAHLQSGAPIRKPSDNAPE